MDEHDRKFNKSNEQNALPKHVVKLEHIYDLKDIFKKLSNYKLQTSTLRFELVNLGSEIKHQNINLGFGLSLKERNSFIHLLKKYKKKPIFF